MGSDAKHELERLLTEMGADDLWSNKVKKKAADRKLLFAWAGVLSTDEVDEYGVLLTGETDYCIWVDAIEPGVDYDLLVRNEHGALVVKDQKPATDAHVHFRTDYTQPHSLHVSAAKGTSRYALLVYERE